MKILLGVTGGIAAYKTASLVRLWGRQGNEVQVVLTPEAHQFVTPLTLATLSKRPALTAFQQDDTGVWNNHVELGLWADVMVVAPATSNTLSKMAHGICDNLLLATYLSARCPVFFAPAMDLDMHAHPAVQENIKRLQSFGNHLIPAASGELASGLSGQGRMAEPETIAAEVSRFFSSKDNPLSGKKVLLTAGPTREAIDPVRFLSNHSTGKMGYALAAEARHRGAEVVLISGPTALPRPYGVTFISVRSAQEMFEAAQAHFPQTDIALLSAAVADYRPATVAEEKIKKQPDTDLRLQLVRTPDIAAQLGKHKQKGQILVGFALETENENANARRKLERKHFDLIVLNSLRHKGAGFAHDTNQVAILSRDEAWEYPLKPKKEVAEDIWDRIAACFFA